MEQEQESRKNLKIEKAAGLERTEENLENGEYEAYQYVGGLSDVWDKFFKIRKADTKAHVDFVQCVECKVLLSFKEYSGTSHLSRHKCRKSKGDENGKYRRLPIDKVEPTKSFITSNIIKLCTREFLPFDGVCSSSNLLTWAQSFVTLGYKHGNINLQEVFPNHSRIDREIKNLRDENMRALYDNYRESLKNNCCSATLEIRKCGDNKQVIVMSIQYFTKELKGLNKQVFSSTILEEGYTPDAFFLEFEKQFSLVFVTPNEEIFSKSLAHPITRNNCVADTIVKLLDLAFETDDPDNILAQCRDTVEFVNSCEKFDVVLTKDDGSWQSKIGMIRSIYENYEAVTTGFEKDNKKNTLKFTLRKAEEVLMFLEPFGEALEDLCAYAYPTANKVLLWWKVLGDHLKKEQNCSWDLKRVIAIMNTDFDENFRPTADNKINCFLDPRYRSLKMLSESEKTCVLADVRALLDSMEDDAVEVAPIKNVPGTKRNRFSSFEAEKPNKEKPKKKNRFERYECTNTDLEDNDEVSNYLKLPTIKIDNEFDIIEKFWKPKKQTLPKLFKLVSSRLHVPACSGIAGSQVFSLKYNLKESDLNNYIIVRDNLQ